MNGTNTNKSNYTGQTSPALKTSFAPSSKKRDVSKGNTAPPKKPSSPLSNHLNISSFFFTESQTLINHLKTLPISSQKTRDTINNILASFTDSQKVSLLYTNFSQELQSITFYLTTLLLNPKTSQQHLTAIVDYFRDLCIYETDYRRTQTVKIVEHIFSNVIEKPIALKLKKQTLYLIKDIFNIDSQTVPLKSRIIYLFSKYFKLYKSQKKKDELHHVLRILAKDISKTDKTQLDSDTQKKITEIQEDISDTSSVTSNFSDHSFDDDDTRLIFEEEVTDKTLPKEELAKNTTKAQENERPKKEDVPSVPSETKTLKPLPKEKPQIKEIPTTSQALIPYQPSTSIPQVKTIHTRHVENAKTEQNSKNTCAFDLKSTLYTFMLISLTISYLLIVTGGCLSAPLHTINPDL